jgi:membrane fusion protein, multidrug efflux system
LPVRIALDRDEVHAHPLRVGLSMRVVVATKDRSGLQLAAAAPAGAHDAAAVEDPALAAADARIGAIIRANAATATRGHALAIRPSVAPARRLAGGG